MKRTIFLIIWGYFILFTIYFTLGFLDLSFTIFNSSIFEMIVIESDYLEIARYIIYIPLIPLIFIARIIELSNDLYEIYTMSIGMVALGYYYSTNK